MLLVGFGLAFSAFVLSAATSATVTSTITYCIDTYPELSGEAMITVIVIRNTMGFAITSYAYVSPSASSQLFRYELTMCVQSDPMDSSSWCSEHIYQRRVHLDGYFSGFLGND